MTFFVKCAGCGGIYDAERAKSCPACGTGDITPRTRWSKTDYENESREAQRCLGKQEKEGMQE